MSNRQAKHFAAIFALLFLMAGCSTPTQPAPAPTLTPQPPTGTPAPTHTPSPIPPTATPTPLACLSQPGSVEEGVVETTDPPQQYLIYLPPCYAERTDLRYPVLYLLHGQTYTQDQWVRLGIPQIADRLILSGASAPFIVVFPDDRYWNLQAGPGFGKRLVDSLIPFVDAAYRTIPDRENRSIGGLSRGGGWAIQLGLERVDLFGSIGLHSPAIFIGEEARLTNLLQSIPVELRPRIWIDAGDADRELASILTFAQTLSENQYLHEFYRYSGDHSESYWRDHAEEYLRWYVAPWNGSQDE